MDSYLVLLRVGFSLPRLLPIVRCALTAPFHPYLLPKESRRYIFCGTFRRLSPPRRYLAPCPVEPGLSSLCINRERLPDRLQAHANRVPNRRPELNLLVLLLANIISHRLWGTFLTFPGRKINERG